MTHPDGAPDALHALPAKAWRFGWYQSPAQLDLKQATGRP